MDENSEIKHNMELSDCVGNLEQYYKFPGEDLHAIRAFKLRDANVPLKIKDGEDAFYKMCIALPKVIEKVVNEGGEDVKVPHDSVMSELCRIAKQMNTDDEDLAMVLSVYLLGFSTYNGFSKVAEDVIEVVDDNSLHRIYEYAKKK